MPQKSQKQDATVSLRRPRDAPNIWVPWKLCVSTKAVEDCAIESPHYNLITIRRWNYFRSIPTNHGT